MATVVVVQSFPQAVFYNRETRMFELRSDAKRKLAREVKTAVRLGKKRNSELYRAVLSNSFSPIPLVPIVEASPEVKRLSAIYTVQVSCLITGRKREVLNCRYCFYSRADFWIFRPAGATCCTDQGEIWQGGADRRTAPPCLLPPLSSAQGCGFSAQNFKKLEFYQYNCP